MIIQERCSEVNKHTHKEAARTAADLAVYWLTFCFLEIQNLAEEEKEMQGGVFGELADGVSAKQKGLN